jgi:heme-degrading monooxygenase HmoA
MHSVVVRVTIKDFDPAFKALHEEVVPRVSQAPGFVAGYWLQPEEDKGMALIVFESEDAAKNAAEQARANVPPPVTMDSIEVREVVAHA